MRQAMSDSLRQALRGDGREWHFGVDDLEALAAEAGLIVVDKLKTADLSRTHWPSQHLDAAFYERYSLVHIGA